MRYSINRPLNNDNTNHPYTDPHQTRGKGVPQKPFVLSLTMLLTTDRDMIKITNILRYSFVENAITELPKRKRRKKNLTKPQHRKRKTTGDSRRSKLDKPVRSPPSIPPPKPKKRVPPLFGCKCQDAPAPPRRTHTHSPTLLRILQWTRGPEATNQPTNHATIKRTRRRRDEWYFVCEGYSFTHKQTQSPISLAPPPSPFEHVHTCADFKLSKLKFRKLHDHTLKI